ncbi:hypothetical protein LCL90_22955 [Bacillus infantis]|uniref:hypothetical protein n=1 Tax=Bacillus infantis TaxID=324767 RepID=UPI001CD22B57|nr:hypothetical protein [Bacillus infantis]MCA1037494.1 hypothetical protein [Bacillus infantis]HER2025502.1 hypothetical protein [Streptococcus pyogenes]
MFNSDFRHGALIFGGLLGGILIIIMLFNLYIDTFDEEYWLSAYIEAEEKLYDCETIHQNEMVGKHGRDIPNIRYNYGECVRFEETAKKYYEKLHDEAYPGFDWESEESY